MSALLDGAPCKCRSLAPGMYSVARGCARHDSDGKGASHIGCVCLYLANGPCLACDENERRGLPRTGLEKMGSAMQQKKSPTRNAA